MKPLARMVGNRYRVPTRVVWAGSTINNLTTARHTACQLRRVGVNGSPELVLKITDVPVNGCEECSNSTPSNSCLQSPRIGTNEQGLTNGSSVCRPRGISARLVGVKMSQSEATRMLRSTRHRCFASIDGASGLARATGLGCGGQYRQCRTSSDCKNSRDST